MNQIDPARMADIYFNRLHFRSIKEVSDRLEELALSRGTPTWCYWREVLAHLKSKSEQMPSYKNRKTEGEVAHVSL